MIEVQQGQESLAVLAERAQVPRLTDREDAPAGMGRQPSLSRLGGGEERPLHAQIGVDVLHAHPLELIQLLRVGYRHDGAGGFDTHDTFWGELEPDGCSGGRADFLQLEGWTYQGCIEEDVERAPGHAELAVTDPDLTPGGRFRPLGVNGDEPILHPRSRKAPLLSQRFRLAHGPAEDLGQSRALDRVLAEIGQPDHGKRHDDPLVSLHPCAQSRQEVGEIRRVVLFDVVHVIAAFSNVIKRMYHPLVFDFRLNKPQRLYDLDFPAIHRISCEMYAPSWGKDQ